MPLINSKELLLDAQSHGYAVGAFNVENMEMIQAVIAAAQQECAPVIIQTTPSTVRYASTATFAAIVQSIAAKATVPIAMHLDHGSSFNLCEQAAADGYTSLMIDGSALSFDDNIALTQKVVQMAQKRVSTPSVEAELGKLGGKEDDIEVAVDDDLYTDPQQAAIFTQRTGVDSLAIAIGTSHGFYAGEPKLEFTRLAQLRNAVSVPLVLHGTSGVPDADVRRAITLGICKVNFATELRVAYTKAVRECLASDETIYDPKRFGATAQEAVISLVRHRIAVCSSNV